MIRTLPLLFLLATATAAADGRVETIADARDILVKGDFKVGDRVAFRGGKENDVLGWGLVYEIRADGVAAVHLRLHEQNAQVIVGDKVEVVNLDGKDPRFPGRVDLLQRAHEIESARYKPLAWSGPFFPLGHTLDKGEILLDPLMVEVGITNELTLFAQPLTVVAGLYGGGFKLGLFNNDLFQFTSYLTVYYVPNAVGARGSISPGGVLTLYTNSKFMSHLEGVISIGFSRSDAQPTEDEQEVNIRRGVATSIRSNSEYIFDNWDRLQFGPTYNFEFDSFGGVLGYLWVFDTFHLGLAVRTVDFRNLKLNFVSGYAPWLTFFWRI